MFRSVCIDELLDSESGEKWFEVYVVLNDGSVSSDYDEVVSSLEDAVKIVRRFVNACIV